MSSLNKEVSDLLGTQLPAPQCRVARELLAGLCFEGQVAVASFLVRAQGSGTLEKAIGRMSRLSESHWKSQDEKVRGNPDHGENARLLADACDDCDVLPPWERPQPVPCV